MRNIVLNNVRPFVDGKITEPTKICLVDGAWASSAPEGTPEFDAKGAIALPALFGLGLDFKEPLRDDIYTFKDGVEAMRRGGFYGGLYESCANAIDDSLKLAAIQQISAKCGLSIAFLGAFSMGYQCKDLAEMVELSEGGVVGFGDGNQNCARTRFLRLAMEYGSMTGKRFFFMPLDDSLRHHGLVHEGCYADTLGMKGIPRIAETMEVFRILEMARFLKVPVHFKQVSCGETLKLIERARTQGVDVTCDVDIYHLLLDDSCLFDLDSHCNVPMPFRSAEDREALWQGLESGTVNAISVNHDPVLRQDKEVNFEDAVPGACRERFRWKSRSPQSGNRSARGCPPRARWNSFPPPRHSLPVLNPQGLSRVDRQAWFSLTRMQKRKLPPRCSRARPATARSWARSCLPEFSGLTSTEPGPRNSP